MVSMPKTRTLRLGVLEGELGRIQAEEICAHLGRRRNLIRCEVHSRPIKTPRRGRGPRLGDVPVREFYSEPLHRALLAGEIDVAVHRMKDFPAVLPEGVRIAAVLPRKTPLDVFVGREGMILDDLPSGARVGVSSLRRRAQLLRYRADLQVEYVLGDLPQRLAYLEEGRLEGIVVAAAGMEWMGLQERVSEVFTMEVMVPAPGQGALGLVVREEDEAAHEAVRGLNDPMSRREIKAERAFLRSLGAWPGAPVGALARHKGEVLRLEAVICSPDGDHVLRKGLDGPPEDPAWLGDHLAREMLKEIGRDLLEAARSQL
jgi:hydroxymethylbilane synthase